MGILRRIRMILNAPRDFSTAQTDETAEFQRFWEEGLLISPSSYVWTMIPLFPLTVMMIVTVVLTIAYPASALERAAVFIIVAACAGFCRMCAIDCSQRYELDATKITIRRGKDCRIILWDEVSRLDYALCGDGRHTMERSTYIRCLTKAYTGELNGRKSFFYYRRHKNTAFFFDATPLNCWYFRMNSPITIADYRKETLRGG